MRLFGIVLVALGLLAVLLGICVWVWGIWIWGFDIINLFDLIDDPSYTVKPRLMGFLGYAILGMTFIFVGLYFYIKASKSKGG